MHRLTHETDEDGDGVAALFKTYAFGHDLGQGAAKAVSHVGDESVFARTLRKIDHTRTVLGDDGLLGVVVEILANNQDRLSIVITVRIREGCISCKRNVARDLFP